MTYLIRAANRHDAWHQGVTYLLSNPDDVNVILDIQDPMHEPAEGHDARDRIDAYYEQRDRPSTHSIAELIFPGSEYRRNGMEGVYQTYPEQIEEFRRHDVHHWGTYAERMLRVTLADGTILRGKDHRPLNPLRTLIYKMKRANNGGQAAHACYELSINRPWRDDNVIRGAPCLSHLSFKLHNHAVHLTAIYRNHDYTFKVPGNLLGLARLQAAVAREIGGSVGPLVIHSTQAYLDNKAGTRKLVKPA